MSEYDISVGIGELTEATPVADIPDLFHDWVEPEPSPVITSEYWGGRCLVVETVDGKALKRGTKASPAN